MKTLRIYIVIALIAFCGFNAHSQLIGKGSNETIVLENAEIHTVTHGIVQGSVWLENGKIKAVGDVNAPSRYQTHELSG